MTWFEFIFLVREYGWFVFLGAVVVAIAGGVALKVVGAL